MTDILVIDQLPQGVIEIYRDVNAVASELHIPYLVVGATARDLILYHGFGAAIERGTRDIDIVPFGFDEQSAEIAWPPNGDVVMTILGFHEALEHSIQVQIAKETRINVCFPAAMAALKLVACVERDPAIRSKDASDLLYLIRCYAKIPQVNELLFSDGYMERRGYDEHLAAAEKLGTDMLAIMSEATGSFLWLQIFSQQPKIDALARHMKLQSHEPLDRCHDLIDAFITGTKLNRG